MAYRRKQGAKKLAAKSVKPPVNPAMHYSVMIALVISNITSLGLAFLMAQFLGVSMGNIAYIGELQNTAPAYAQSATFGAKTTVGQNPTPMPSPVPICEGRWAICSQICDDDYSDGLLTRGGWNRCERDCDLRASLCERTGQWLEDIKVRDTKFNP